MRIVTSALIAAALAAGAFTMSASAGPFQGGLGTSIAGGASRASTAHPGFGRAVPSYLTTLPQHGCFREGYVDDNGNPAKRTRCLW